MSISQVRTHSGLLLMGSPESPAERAAQKRKIRKHQVLDAIRRHGPIPRVDIARVLGFNLPTVSSLVDEIVSDGLAYEDEAKKTGSGRRPIPVVLNANAACVIGVDVGKSSTIGLITNLNGMILGRSEQPTPSLDEVGSEVDWIDSFTEDLLRSHSATLPPIAGMGLALPGLISRNNTTVPSIEPRADALRTRLKQRIDVPVIVDNDARMMALGILWFGDVSDVKSFVVVNIGHGLGMGVVLDCRLFQGSRGHAGEIGHLPLGEPGLPCYCGGTSCLENTASGSGLERMAREQGLVSAGGYPLNAYEVAARARTGDGQAIEIMRRFTTALAEGIASVVNLFDPTSVILAGRVSRSSDLFLADLKDELKRHTLPSVHQEVRLQVSHLYENAGPLGTCACVLHQIFFTSHIQIENVV